MTGRAMNARCGNFVKPFSDDEDDSDAAWFKFAELLAPLLLVIDGHHYNLLVYP